MCWRGIAGVLAAAMALPGADLAPERLELPEFACSAPETAAFAFPKLGHDRHAVLVVESAGCSGSLLAGQEVLGRIRDGSSGQRFDLAEQLRRAQPPALGFRPAEAGFGEVRLALVVTPRVYFYNLRYAGGVVTLTARNTLDNAADLHFRVEAGGASWERAENLGPNSERDFRFEAPDLKPGTQLRVVIDKAGEALESGYRFADIVRAGGRAGR